MASVGREGAQPVLRAPNFTPAFGLGEHREPVQSGALNLSPPLARKSSVCLEQMMPHWVIIG
jgi:hypothetical protein